MNYYNEFDPKAAAWIRQLIVDRLIPAGEVDERSITDVRATDLVGFAQCHFFAGIAGWSLALRLANWPDDREVWTGSCPCQCYSVAGKGKGTGDHRDLWPVFASLIRERRPAIVFGEQVEAAIGYGWFDRLRTDMEAEGYAVGGHVLGAHSVGAPHRRQRLYWVAKSQDANGWGKLEAGGKRIGWGGPSGSGVAGAVDIPAVNGCEVRPHIHAELRRPGLGEGRHSNRLAVTERAERGAVLPGNERDGDDAGRDQASGGDRACGEADGLADTQKRGQRADGGAQRDAGHDDERGTVDGLALANGRDGRGGEQRQQPQDGGGRAVVGVGDTEGGDEQWDRLREGRAQRENRGPSDAHFWSRYDIIPCRDGKARIVEPGVAPLVDGLPRGVVPSCDPGAPGYANATAEARVVRLKGYGNAINPYVAAEFISSTKEIIDL